MYAMIAYVGMYVIGMYVCMNESSYVCVYHMNFVQICVCMYVCIYVLYVCMYVCIFESMYEC